MRGAERLGPRSLCCIYNLHYVETCVTEPGPRHQKALDRFRGERSELATKLDNLNPLEARAAGAESFWYKDVSQEELIEVMDRTVAGERLYPGHTPELQIGEASSESFTPRELEILQGLVEYGSDREIADHLNISIDTVRFHIKNLLSKTGYPSRTKLAIAVVSRKLILPDY